MKGNKCAWDQYNCTQDPNDSNYVLHTVNAMRGLGATGRVYAYGTSNGANEVQILGANSMDDAGQALPIVGIAARSGQMLSKPTRSGPGPFDYNQPCAGDNPCTGGRGVAQLSIHDTDDPVIPYAGGARFHSPVFILSGEEASCETWARQNGCNTTMTNATVAATTHKGGSTTANYVQWDGCPATAPVELYKVEGGSHVGTSAIRGKDVMVTVFEVRTCVCVCVCVCVRVGIGLSHSFCVCCVHVSIIRGDLPHISSLIVSPIHRKWHLSYHHPNSSLRRSKRRTVGTCSRARPPLDREKRRRRYHSTSKF